MSPRSSGPAVAAAPDREGGGPVLGRRFFGWTAVVLLLVLVVLVGALLWLLRPVDITRRGGETQSGIEPVFVLYGPGTGKKPLFDNPVAAAWGPNGRIYVADSKNNRIVVFSNEGRYLQQFGEFGIAKPSAGSAVTWKPGRLNYPTGVATDSDGDVYVADFNNDSISVFDDKGTFLRRFPDPNTPTGRGSSGAGGKGIAVTTVAVAGGKVYAADAFQVFVFDTDGTLLRQFGRPTAGPDGLDHPNGIAVDSQGRIFVSDSNHNRISAFSPDGQVLWNTGAPISDLQAATANPFVLPRGVTLLSDREILVADPLAHQLVKVTTSGEVVAAYGTRGEEPGQVNFPTGVAARGRLILVADKENDRVQAVRLVGP